MTPHDKELKLYNDIIARLEQLEEQIRKLANYDDFTHNLLSREQQDAIVLAGVYCLDTKDKFKRYAGLKYDSNS